MGEQLFNSFTSIALAIVGVAIISALVGRKSNTADVIKSAGTAYSDVLKAALNPLT